MTPTWLLFELSLFSDPRFIITEVAEMQTERRKAKKTRNACIAYRHSKIKCSGREPCDNCQRRLIKCEFTEGVSKVIVSERYIRGLERQVQDLKRAASTNNTSPQSGARCSCTADAAGIRLDTAGSHSEASSSPQAIGYARNIWTSPFTLPSTTIKNTENNKRNWIWLAPSSMWSFTARLTVMLTERLHHTFPNNAPTLLKREEVYPLRWTCCAADEPPDVNGLPFLDYAMHLVNTAKFYLGQNYRLFNEDYFINRLLGFYHGDATKIAAEDRLWFIQLLLVFSFGTAFRSGSRNSRGAPGSSFFVRAMSLMPDHASLWKYSVPAIETLALAGLYLYSIGERESGHIYIGQAVRIAQFEGLHTHLPEDQLGAETVSRCRNLWWTLYTIDSHFSSSVGLPTTTQDWNISTPINPPNTCSHQDVILSLQVKLSRLQSFIIATVYKSEKTQLGTFLETTGSILHTLAGYAEEVEKIIHARFRNSVDRTPNGTRHITLLYHQCVIAATRPLLLSVLKERLDSLDNETEDWQDFLVLTKTLISISIKSAEKTLHILSEDDGLLEVFLPYDLEYTYASSVHLAIANALFPSVVDGQSYSQKAHLILGEMINKGNKVAEVRKAELSHLESLLLELAARAELQGFQPLTLYSPKQPETASRNNSMLEEQPSGESVADHDMVITPNSESSQPREASLSGDIEFLNDIGVSSYEFYTIVDQIANSDLSYSILDSGPI